MNRGEHVKKIIDDLGIRKDQLANRLGISRSVLYTWFKEADLSHAKIRQIGDIVHYDFSQDFPDWPYEVDTDPNILMEPGAEYRNLDACILAFRTLQKKYTQLMERHIELLHRLNAGK